MVIESHVGGRSGPAGFLTLVEITFILEILFVFLILPSRIYMIL